MNSTIQKLGAVIGALNSINVNGKSNLSALYGSIELLESIAVELSKQAEENATVNE